MKSKKILMALVALTMGATTAFAFSACGGNNDDGNVPDDGIIADTPNNHVHCYGDWQITAPTMTEAGSAVKVCADDETHKITETLPNLAGGNYAIAKAEEGYTFTYATAENGNISFGYKTFELKLTADDFTYDEDEYAYFATYTFTAVASKYMSLNVDGYLFDLQVFESEAVYEGYMNWEDDCEPIIDYNSMFNSGTDFEFEAVAGEEYTFFFVTSECDEELSFSLAFDVPVVHNDAVLGENTVTFQKDNETKCYTFKGNPNAGYIVKYSEEDEENPELNELEWVNNFNCSLVGTNTTYSNSGYLLVNANKEGVVAFQLKSYAAGEFTFTLETAPNTVTAIEVKDKNGDDVTEYTLYVNEEDTELLNFINALPEYSTNKTLLFTVEDEEIATVSAIKTDSQGNLNGAFLRGVADGTTKLIITSETDKTVKAEVTLHVETKSNPINVGENKFESLPMAPTLYQFTGEADTKYVVTFTDGTWSYSWKITDASDSDNYVDKYDTKVTYLEVTTDADGKAAIFVYGSATGTITITIASEFDYPADSTDKPEYSDGTWILNSLSNSGINVNANEDTYFEFNGDPDTAYSVTLSEIAKELGQVNSSGSYVSDKAENTNKIKIETDSNGVAYFKAVFTNAVDSLGVDLVASLYDEDSHGYLILKEGANAGLSINAWETKYYAFNGTANSEYTVTFSPNLFMQGHFDLAKDEFIESSGTGTFTLTTDADGVAYIRCTSFDDVAELTVTITYVGEATGGEGGDIGEGGGDNGDAGENGSPAEPVDISSSGTVTFEIGEDETPNFEDELYTRFVTFTPSETGTYTVTYSGEPDSRYYSYDVYTKEKFEAFYYDWDWDASSFINSRTDESVDIELEAGVEYTFVVVVDSSGDYTISIAKKQA